MVSSAVQFGVDPHSLVTLLNGNVSDSGFDITPYRDLGAALSSVGDAWRVLGGPMTEALRVGTGRHLAQLCPKKCIVLRGLAGVWGGSWSGRSEKAWAGPCLLSAQTHTGVLPVSGSVSCLCPQEAQTSNRDCTVSTHALQHVLQVLSHATPLTPGLRMPADSPD